MGGIDKILELTARVSVLDERGLIAPRAARLLEWREKHRGKSEVPRPEVEVFYHRLDELRNDLVAILKPQCLHVKETADFTFDYDTLSNFDQRVCRDLTEACSCFATGCFTASVFHAQRAAETALLKLTKREKVKISGKDRSWQAMTDRLNAHLNNLPSMTSRQILRRKRLSRILAHLNALRIAWRNPVMHPGEFYNQIEAREILQNTSTLMRYLTL